MNKMNKVELFKRLSQEQCDLYAIKNAAYGDSFGDTYKKLGLISAITRITDKYNRLVNLATHSQVDNLGESIEDTLRDLSNYCLMTVIEIQGNTSLENTSTIDSEHKKFDRKISSEPYITEDRIIPDDVILAMERMKCAERMKYANVVDKKTID